MFFGNDLLVVLFMFILDYGNDTRQKAILFQKQLGQLATPTTHLVRENYRCEVLFLLFFATAPNYFLIEL